jgi:hypothetical protein
MDGRHWRFLAALALFAVWVTFLGALAIFSGREPPARPAPAQVAQP